MKQEERSEKSIDGSFRLLQHETVEHQQKLERNLNIFSVQSV